jgi:hypothetical protein
MKRYWTSILLVPVIVLCIGTYYIQAAAFGLPQFVIEKQEGDENAADGVDLSGQYGGSNRSSEPLNIGLQGSEYVNEKSFFERLSPYWGSEEVKRLAEEYRDFMRGKRGPQSFYEDDGLLAYVNVKEDNLPGTGRVNYRFEVSSQDKKNGRSSSYEVAVPNGNRYGMVQVQDVQATQGQLKVVTQNFMKNNGQTEIHLYSLDEVNRQTPADRTLWKQPPGSADTDTNISAVYETDWVHANPYSAFLVSQYQRNKTDQSGSEAKKTGSQLLIFDIRTGEEVKLESQEIRDFLSGDWEMKQGGISIQGDNLYLAKNGGNGFNVIRWSIPDAKLSMQEIRSDSVTYSILKNDRFYMLTRRNPKELPSLVVADANTGSVLFKGTVSLKGSEQQRAEKLAKLTIYAVNVK